MSDQISIGSCNGDFELDDIINAISAVNFLSSSTTDFDRLKVNCPKQKESKNIWLLPNDKLLSKTKPFLDFQNDSTAKDVKLAEKGFRSIEHVKRYTTTAWGQIKENLQICMHSELS